MRYMFTPLLLIALLGCAEMNRANAAMAEPAPFEQHAELKHHDDPWKPSDDLKPIPRPGEQRCPSRLTYCATPDQPVSS